MTTKHVFNDDWPSHSEELARKTSETLHDVAWRIENGKLTYREGLLITRALEKTIEGLAPWDVVDVLRAFQRECAKKHKRGKAKSRKRETA